MSNYRASSSPASARPRPLGGTAPESWSALLAGASGTHTLEDDWVESTSCRHASPPRPWSAPSTVLERPVAKRLDPSAQFALVAAREAWEDAGAPDVDPERLGVDFATGIGGSGRCSTAGTRCRRRAPGVSCR